MEMQIWCKFFFSLCSCHFVPSCILHNMYICFNVSLNSYILNWGRFLKNVMKYYIFPITFPLLFLSIFSSLKQMYGFTKNLYLLKKKKKNNFCPSETTVWQRRLMTSGKCPNMYFDLVHLRE